MTVNARLANTWGFPIHEDAFVECKIPGLENVWIKLEGLNPAGSIKLKTAIALVQALAEKGELTSRSVVVESSSGNLGIALSMVCAAKHISFHCVCDPNTVNVTIETMRSFGARVDVIDRKDNNGGYLGSRIEHVENLCSTDPHYMWTNQYANPAAKLAHHWWTGPAIATAFPDITHLFVGVGTSGTAMGCAEYFRKTKPRVKVIGVDSVGSVNFGGPGGPRYLPGLGSSQRPPLLKLDLLDSYLAISEKTTVEFCWKFRRYHGIAVGPSTGTVLAAVSALGNRLPKTARVVAISPDLGERYLGSLYNRDWVEARFPSVQLH